MQNRQATLDAHDALGSISHWFAALGSKIKDAGLWIAHLFSTIGGSIFAVFRSIGHWIYAVALTVLTAIKIIFFSLIAIVALIVFVSLARWLWSLQQAHAHRLRVQREYQRCQEDVEAQARLVRRNHQARLAEDRERWEREQAALEREREARRQEEQKQEEQERQKQQEQDKKREQDRARAQQRRQADEQARQEAEQRRKREAYLEKQQDEQAYQTWTAQCTIAFKDLTKDIPSPPSWPCFDVACVSEQRLFKACRHSYHRWLNAGSNPSERVDEERKRWHPDRPYFTRRGKEACKMADEVFKEICRHDPRMNAR